MSDSLEKDSSLALKRALQAFQSARLNNTYADLKKSAEYAQIGHFFSISCMPLKTFLFETPALKSCIKS